MMVASSKPKQTHSFERETQLAGMCHVDDFCLLQTNSRLLFDIMWH